MYIDQDVDPAVMNAAAVVKQVAEQAAQIYLSKDEQVLIQNYFAQVAADIPSFPDTSD